MADIHCFEVTLVEFRKRDQIAKTRLYLGIYLTHGIYSTRSLMLTYKIQKALFNLMSYKEDTSVSLK